MSGAGRPPPRRSSAAKGPGAPTGIDRLAHRIAQQTLRVRSGDRAIEMTTAEAILMATARSAAAGNSSASWLILDCFRRADERLASEMAERRKLATDFKQDQARRIARAAAVGEDSTRILPHPDDIDPDHPAGPRITGPATPEEWRTALRGVRLREAWLLQHALERSLDRSRQRNKDRSGASEEDRSQDSITVPGDALCMMELAHLSQRELLKQTRAAWAAAGTPLPRGTRAPPPGQMLEVLSAGVRAAREVLAPGFDPRDVEAVAADLYDEVVGIMRVWNGRSEREGKSGASGRPALPVPPGQLQVGRRPRDVLQGCSIFRRSRYLQRVSCRRSPTQRPRRFRDPTGGPMSHRQGGG